MRIGIVAEFNPLHSGHRYLIECARKLADENNGEVICVMSAYLYVYVSISISVLC